MLITFCVPDVMNKSEIYPLEITMQYPCVPMAGQEFLFPMGKFKGYPKGSVHRFKIERTLYYVPCNSSRSIAAVFLKELPECPFR